MLQVLQFQKTGEIKVDELPEPVCPENGILVKNYYSLISAGTERSSVEKAQSSLLSRIKKQPEDVKLVIDFIKKEGIKSTLNRVKTKLESYKVLGYSSSGIVIESGCSEFNPGDRVACGGAGYANHSEIVAIPKNLAVKIPENVEFEDAAFTTLCAIALQGIRQTEPLLGDNVAVIGLGLIGLITVQLLKANGTKVLGIDISEDNFELARQLGCDRTVLSNSDALESARAFSSGMLMDSVIITAATESNQPIELAMSMARKKGKVVIVGAVGMNIQRGPFYTKEIDLKISCSYGPGRYDPYYEELGIDYPFPYVRWTENRNMATSLQLMESGRLNIKKLTSHIFQIDDAQNAYNLITGKSSEKYLGILLKYDKNTKPVKKQIVLKAISSDKLNIGFVGLGSFAQNHLLPNIIKSGFKLGGVANQTPASSLSIAEKSGFSFYSSDYKELINNPITGTVFCASRHDSHSKIVIESINAGKPIFVEKPLAVNREELDEIREAFNKTPSTLMCGFNRRFSESFRTIKKFIQGNNYPLTMIYRVNAGFIPKEHWVQQPLQGGRIIGEACHFIDTMLFLCESKPKKVFAESISSQSSANIYDRDNVSITIKFENGSIGTLIYTAAGSAILPKEYFELHSERKSAIMNNFETVELFGGKGRKILKMDSDKGISEEIKSFYNAIKNNLKSPIDFDELVGVTETTFAAVESLETGRPINIR